MCPLREVAGAEGIVRVQVPFSIQDLSQIEKRLGSYSADSDTFIKEFRHLSQAYDLTGQDIHTILTSSLTSEERLRIWQAAQDHADQQRLADQTLLPGKDAVPDASPSWGYQDGQRGRDHVACMIQHLLAGMQIVSNKVVNYDKLRDVIQGPDENPAMFLNRLTEALMRYTKIDPESPPGATILATHFISQSAPDIRKKLRRVEEGPQTPIRDLVKIAFKVYNTREDTKLQKKVALQSQTLVAALRPVSQRGNRCSTPPGACFKCGKEGHWSAFCPNPRPPKGPCPICKQRGHWKSDCPMAGSAPAPPRRDPASQVAPSFELLGLAEDD